MNPVFRDPEIPKKGVAIVLLTCEMRVHSVEGNASAYFYEQMADHFPREMTIAVYKDGVAIKTEKCRGRCNGGLHCGCFPRSLESYNALVERDL